MARLTIKEVYGFQGDLFVEASEDGPVTRCNSYVMAETPSGDFVHPHPFHFVIEANDFAARIRARGWLDSDLWREAISREDLAAYNAREEADYEIAHGAPAGSWAYASAGL